MTTPELDISTRMLDRLTKPNASAATDLAAFETMSPSRQSATRAGPKSFEQIGDQLSRGFRAIPRLIGVDAARWFSRDNADFTETLGVLDDAATRSRVVKLRNQLVHDYPLDPQLRFERLTDVIGFLPSLAGIHRRLAAFVRDELPEKML